VNTLIKFKEKICITLALFFALALVLQSTPLVAQSSGKLTGTATDASDAAVRKAIVTLTEQSTNTVYKSSTTDQGLYTFSDVSPGTYNVSVIAPTFKQYSQDGVTIAVGQTVTVNAKLDIGSANEVVTVNSDASQLQTETSDIGTSISPKLLEDLPLSFGGTVRDPLQFVSLTPGYAGNVTNSPTAPPSGGFKINGGQQDGVQIILDGANLNLISANMQQNYGVSVEAISEFKVESNTFNAEYGKASGGLVNLVTKSGTNRIHGSVYDLLKNRDLDANNWVSNFNGTTRPIDTQNDFGGIVSGPVVIPKLYNGRDKTFFLFNYEGFRFNTGGVSLLSAPTTAMAGGDFSSLLNPITVDGQNFPAHILYDYRTCTGTNQGKTCTAFPGNKIDASLEDPIFKAASAVLPLSTGTSPYFNTVVTSENPVSANLWEVKIDQNIGSKVKIAGSYDYDSRPNTVLSSLGPLETSATNQQTHYVRLSFDYVITPNLLNHLNYGFTRRFRQEDSGIGGRGGNWPTKLGLKGVGDEVFPIFNYNYPNGTNVPSDGANEFADNASQVDEQVSWQHGRHSFRFGGQYRPGQFNIRILTGTSGQFNFNSGPTSTPSDTNSGFGYASFFLGATSNAFIALPEKLGWRSKYIAGFVTDDWKVTPKLTANLGLRYELTLPTVEAHDQLSYFDANIPNPGAGNLLGAYAFAGDGPGRTGQRTPQTTFRKSIGPRLGFAYAVHPETVIRAAYGIYFNNLSVGGFAENDSQGFAGNYTYPSSPSPQTPTVVLSQITQYPGNQPPFINPTAQNGATPTAILSKVARPGTIQNWTLDIQQQLPGKVLLDIGYVGAHGDHLQAFMHDPNQGLPANQSRGACLEVNITDQASNPVCAGQPIVAAPFAGFSGTVSQALRPYPQYSNFNVDSATMADPFGDYTFNALQIQVTKRISHGLTLLANYSWSKNITNADSEYPEQAEWEGNGTSGALNTYNLKVEKSVSAFDTPQRAVFSYTYELPFGRDKPFLNQNRVANVLAGGWQIAAVQTYQSGTPLAVTSPNWDSGIFAGNLCGGCSRPNVVAGVNQNALQGSFVYGQSRRLNPAAFTIAPNFTFGDAPRALGIRELATLNEDANVSKKIPLGTERLQAVFRMEFFDVLNRHRFTGFNTSVGQPGFGLASSATGPRNMQANLRITF
jgi:Carboxypeptidase regulatory-like domain